MGSTGKNVPSSRSYKTKYQIGPFSDQSRRDDSLQSVFLLLLPLCHLRWKLDPPESGKDVFGFLGTQQVPQLLELKEEEGTLL